MLSFPSSLQKGGEGEETLLIASGKWHYWGGFPIANITTRGSALGNLYISFLYFKNANIRLKCPFLHSSILRGINF